MATVYTRIHYNCILIYTHIVAGQNPIPVAAQIPRITVFCWDVNYSPYFGWLVMITIPI